MLCQYTQGPEGHCHNEAEYAQPSIRGNILLQLCEFHSDVWYEQQVWEMYAEGLVYVKIDTETDDMSWTWSHKVRQQELEDIARYVNEREGQEEAP